jgi:hypothetical protein
VTAARSRRRRATHTANAERREAWRVKHLLLAAMVALYVIVWSQNWTWFAGAIMVRAIIDDRRRETALRAATSTTA